jgi:integrase/recombinase XerD
MKDLQKALCSLKRDNAISESNKELIFWMLNECAAEGVGEGQQLKYLFTLKALLKKFCPKDLDLRKAQEGQLKNIVAQINRSDYAESTKRAFKVALKKLYKLINHGVYPEMVRFIKTSEGKSTVVTWEDLYTREEIRAILAHMLNLRDRAFIQVLYETGARPGELINAKVGDVLFNERGDFIFLKGIKGTPDRTIQLVESGFLLREWLKSHPACGDPYHPKDPSAPLWVKLEQMRCKHCKNTPQKHPKDCTFEPMEMEQANYDCLRRAFLKACEKAGVRKKKLRFYNFRHTRLTEVSQFLSHEQMCKFAGWKPGSGQFETYVHLTSEDVNEAIRKRYGLVNNGKPEKIHCPVCGQINGSERIECLNCRRPLSFENAMKREELSRALEVLAELQEKGKLEELLMMALKVQRGPRRSHKSG